jgi:hypothetical protein
VPSDLLAATPELQPAVDYARIEEGFHVVDDAVFVLEAGDVVKDVNLYPDRVVLNIFELPGSETGSQNRKDWLLR